jgi:hypothetical protein
MRALYLFLDRTTGVGRPLHPADEPLPPIRTGAFAAWLASAPAARRSSSPSDDATGRSTTSHGAEQAAGPSNVPAASRP